MIQAQSGEDHQRHRPYSSNRNKPGTISHGLATALINREGKIDKIWRGNAWNPGEVTEVIRAEK
jgi:hypothetical protein